MIDPSIHAQLAMAEWVKILITAVVGFTSAVLVDMLKTRINERRRRRGLRKAMYDELAGILGHCDAVLEINSPNQEQAEILAKVLAAASTDAYRMAKTDPVVFYSLKEWQTFDKLYYKIEFFKKALALQNSAVMVSQQAQEFRNEFMTALGGGKLKQNVFTPGESKNLNIDVGAKSGKAGSQS